MIRFKIADDKKAETWNVCREIANRKCLDEKKRQLIIENNN